MREQLIEEKPDRRKQRTRRMLRDALLELIDALTADADDLGSRKQLEQLRALVIGQHNDSRWLREVAAAAGNLNDLTRMATERFAKPSSYRPHV